MLLQLPPFLDASYIERKIIEEKWGPGKKPPQPMRGTGEKNRKTTENILAPLRS